VHGAHCLQSPRCIVIVRASSVFLPLFSSDALHVVISFILHLRRAVIPLASSPRLPPSTLRAPPLGLDQNLRYPSSLSDASSSILKKTRLSLDDQSPRPLSINELDTSGI